jgi:hypothetical protein
LYNIDTTYIYEDTVLNLNFETTSSKLGASLGQLTKCLGLVMNNSQKKKIYADGLAVGIDCADGGHRHSSTLNTNEKSVPTAAVGTALPMPTAIMCRRRSCLSTLFLCCADGPDKLPSAQFLAVGPLFLSRSEQYMSNIFPWHILIFRNI